MQYNVVPWHNENALTEYPLVRSYGYNGFLVDAQITQFDNFVPTLKTVKVTNSDAEVTLTLQTGDLVVTIPITNFQASPYTHELVYDGYSVGFLSFGINAYTMLTNEMVNLVTKTLNIPFLTSAIVSIPSSSGVFSLNGRYGALTFEETDDVHFNQSGQEVTVDFYTLPQEFSETYLKTLNDVEPTDNRINLILPDIIRAKAIGPATLQLNLIGNSSPTDLNNIIVTDG